MGGLAFISFLEESHIEGEEEGWGVLVLEGEGMEEVSEI